LFGLSSAVVTWGKDMRHALPNHHHRKMQSWILPQLYLPGDLPGLICIDSRPTIIETARTTVGGRGCLRRRLVTTAGTLDSPDSTTLGLYPARPGQI
jgi:hypothetical protein